MQGSAGRSGKEMVKMGRHGENIHKRRDGRWEARYIQSYAADGKAQYRSLYGKTYREAREKQKAALHTLSNSATDATFASAAEEWLAAKKSCVKESTYANYVHTVRKHLIPALGRLSLQAVTPTLLEGFLQDKLQTGRLDGTGRLSPKTVADLHALLKLILQHARLLGKYSAADFTIPAPTGRSGKIRVLTAEEQSRLERVLFAEPEPLCLGILLSLYAGLRIGEVCALQWGDFRFGEGTVRVCKTIIRIQNTEPDAKTRTKVLLTEPKTACSDRVIPLPSFLLNHLFERRCADDCFLLTSTPRFMEPRVCLQKYKGVLRRAGLEDCTFHTLHHTFATRCVENHFDVKSLSEIMGHSSITVTMQRYVHPSMALKREQMNRLSQIAFCGQDYSQESQGKP